MRLLILTLLILLLWHVLSTDNGESFAEKYKALWNRDVDTSAIQVVYIVDPNMPAPVVQNTTINISVTFNGRVVTNNESEKIIQQTEPISTGMSYHIENNIDDRIFITSWSDSFVKIRVAIGANINHTAKLVSINRAGKSCISDIVLNMYYSSTTRIPINTSTFYTPCYPSTDPYTISVGMTYISEYGIELASGASGGGPSTLFNIPDYQRNRDLPFIDFHYPKMPTNNRGTPDVALLGRNENLVGYDNETHLINMTSSSAPAISSLLAWIDRKPGKTFYDAQYSKYGIKNILYNASSDCYNDISDGESNGVIAPHQIGANFMPDIYGENLYSPRIGYDFVTGLGTVNGKKLIDHLNGSQRDRIL